MKLLPDLISRNMLFPALRLMRSQMRLIDDPLKLRRAAARVDALGRMPPGAKREPVLADTVPATWIDVKGARRDRVVLYLHGGAFITETPQFHGALLARICQQARVRGLMPSYRLAPEHRYPAALDDCLASYRWLLAQGVAAERIVVAGDSAGGNLTLALLLRLRDEGLPLPAGAVALSPVADLSFSGDSVRRNDGIDDLFSADLVDALVPVYLDRREQRSDPLVSPLFGDFDGMPPLLLVVGSTELLLDDSVRLAQRWPESSLQVWHGMPHVFAGFEMLPEAQQAVQRIGRFVRDRVAGGAAPQAAAPGLAEAAPLAAAQTEIDAPAPAPQTPPLSVRARLWAAVAVLSGLMWLAVVVLGLGPLLLLVHPLVWLALAALGAAWVLAMLLYLRAGGGAGFGRRGR